MGTKFQVQNKKNFKMKTIFLTLVLLAALSYSRNLPNEVRDNCCKELKKCCCGKNGQSSAGGGSGSILDGSSSSSKSEYDEGDLIEGSFTTEPNTPTTEEVTTEHFKTTKEVTTPQEITTPRTQIDIEIECNCDDENDL